MQLQSDAPLLKRTLLTIVVMLGACVAFVGTLCLVALLIVGKAVGPSAASASNGPAAVPADNVRGPTPTPGALAQPASTGTAPSTTARRGKLL